MLSLVQGTPNGFFLYLFAIGKKMANNIAHDSSRANTFLVIERSKGLTCSPSAFNSTIFPS